MRFKLRQLTHSSTRNRDSRSIAAFAAIPCKRPVTKRAFLAAVAASISAGCHGLPGPYPRVSAPPVEPPASQPVTQAASQPADAFSKFEYHQLKFGSDFNLVIYAPDQPTADAAAAAAYAEVDRLDKFFNDYDPQSEISKLSLLTRDGPMEKPVAVSTELGDLLELSLSVARSTQGAFDPTIGPYVQLWRRSRRLQQKPSRERLDEARKSVGWEKVEIRPASVLSPDGTGFNVRLTAPKMRLDLGGIAGGYVADHILLLLKQRCLPMSLVDSSGDLAIGDPPPGRAGWRVAIQSLTEPNQVADFLLVHNCGVSTSGDTYRFVEIDGVRYSHIVDSRTGLGLTHRLGVTTIAPLGVQADWLATAVSAMGAEKGLAWVESMNRTAAKNVGWGARITSVNEAGEVSVIRSEGYKKAVDRNGRD